MNNTVLETCTGGRELKYYILNSMDKVKAWMAKALLRLVLYATWSNHGRSLDWKQNQSCQFIVIKSVFKN